MSKKSKIINVQTDPKTKEGFLNLQDLADFVDVDQVKFYELETTPQGLSVRFFDADQKPLKPKAGS